jgi:recombination protein RecR
MSGALPAPLQNLVGKLAKLPGLGPKSAMRIAITLLKWPEAETRRFGEDIASLRDTLRLCSRCGALSATDPCRICADANRDQTVLCVIPEWDSMLALEEAGFYNGYYFVGRITCAS